MMQLFFSGCCDLGSDPAAQGRQGADAGMFECLEWVKFMFYPLHSKYICIYMTWFRALHIYCGIPNIPPPHLPKGGECWG